MHIHFLMMNRVSVKGIVGSFLTHSAPVGHALGLIASLSGISQVCRRPITCFRDLQNRKTARDAYRDITSLFIYMHVRCAFWSIN